MNQKRQEIFPNRYFCPNDTHLTIFIKNMVCPRCITAVSQTLKDVGASPLSVQLGEVQLPEPLSPGQQEQLSLRLKTLGFELLDDKRQRQIEQIKSLIIQQVQKLDGEKLTVSGLLSKALHREYSQLSKLFSETEGITIEHFTILQRIEKVKELLIYDEMNLGEIAEALGYSSVAHLSAQFRKVTGMTPSAFRRQGSRLRRPLDGLGGGHLAGQDPPSKV
jgi:AraC family transcriptional regulator